MIGNYGLVSLILLFSTMSLWVALSSFIHKVSTRWLLLHVWCFPFFAHASKIFKIIMFIKVHQTYNILSKVKYFEYMSFIIKFTFTDFVWLQIKCEHETMCVCDCHVSNGLILNCCKHETMCVCNCHVSMVSSYIVVHMRPCVFVTVMCQ